MFSGLYRGYDCSREKPGEVTRIVVVGDSMVFGDGVVVSDALPARLEYHLNGALPLSLVEVANHGRNGYNIQHSLNLLRHHSLKHSPDLVLLVLCENDAELYSSRSGYMEHLEMTWADGCAFRDHFRLGLEQFKAACDEAAVPLMVVVYGLAAHGLPFPGIIGGLCERLGLPFVDLTEEYKDNPTAPEMRVSRVNGHPSHLGHDVAARRLARDIVTGQVLARASSFPDETAMIEASIPIARRIGRATGRLDLAALKVRGWVERKRGGRARMRLKPPQLAPDETFGAALRTLTDIARLQGRMDRLSSCAADLKSGVAFTTIENIWFASGNGPVDVNVLENITRTGAPIPPDSELEQGHWPDVNPQEIDGFAASLEAVAERLGAIEARWFDTIAEATGLGAGASAGEHAGALEILRESRSLIGRTASEWRRVLTSPVRDALADQGLLGKLARRACAQLSVLDTLCRHLLPVLGLERIEQALAYDDAAQWTDFTVAVRAPEAGYRSVAVRAKGLHGFHVPVEESQLFEMDNQWAAYRFRFPAFHRAELELWIVGDPKDPPVEIKDGTVTTASRFVPLFMSERIEAPYVRISSGVIHL